MTADASGAPVERFEFSTRTEGEAEAFVQRMYVDNRTRFLGSRDDSRFDVRVANAPELAADHFHASVDYATDVDPLDYFFFVAVRNGRVTVRGGAEELVVRAGGQALYPMGVPLSVEAMEIDVTSVRMPARRLERAAHEIAGIETKRLRFTGHTPVSTAMARHWSTVMALANATVLDDETVMSHPLLVDELARTVALTALHTFPNSCMARAHSPAVGGVGPSALRRAVAHIEDNAHLPLTLSDIAHAAGTTPRALQYAFRRHHGVTPMEFVRRVRLERAHQELVAADPSRGATVAATARSWGFASAGRFAGYYRDRYGHSPSETLRT